MNIHIERYGQGKPIVFFHGWGFDSQIWQSLIPYLNQEYELLLVDLPGFGLTSMMDWQNFKENLLLKLPPHFALAGWSMGGLYAMRLALETNGRVTKLLAINSSPYFIADKEWPGVNKEVFTSFYNNVMADIDKTLKNFIELQVSKNKFDYLPGAQASLQGLESGMTILEQWDFREKIKGLSLPLCFMFGRLDPITPVKIMSAMQEIYPAYKYILFNRAAHMPFLSHTEFFVKELSEFMQ